MSSTQQEELFNSSQFDLEDEVSVRQYREQMLRTVLPMVEDKVSRSSMMRDYNLHRQEMVSKSINSIDSNWDEFYRADLQLNSRNLLYKYIKTAILEATKTPIRRHKIASNNKCSLLAMSVFRLIDSPVELDCDYQQLLEVLKEELTPREYDSLTSKAETGRPDIPYLVLKHNCSKKTIYNSIDSAKAKARKLLDK